MFKKIEIWPYNKYWKINSYILGISRILDLGKTLQSYKINYRGEEADAYAIYSDWCEIGDDIRKVIRDSKK